jgi:hypothetical protein
VVPAPCVRGEPDARERARPVRRAAAGRPTAERLHGARPPTLHLPLASEAAAALFQVIAKRYLRGSVILTTNLGIASWGRIFDDATVAAAMLDRLLHRSVVFDIDGDSYRMRAHRARVEKLRKGVMASDER